MYFRASFIAKLLLFHMQINVTQMVSKLLTILLFVTSSHLMAQNYNLVERSHMDWPGQTLANICGWTSPDGKEYALVGGSQGLIIVDISNPAAPVQIVQIPGPNNLWKEIKVYKHYAYVTSEGGQGLQIVDLSGLPSANLTYHYYTGTGALAGQLNAIHALHIDTTGFVYLFGGGQNGATIHSLEPDPYNPTYVGQYQQGGYVHDGYANNDTLYAGHIYTGLMTVVDCSDKSNPVVLGSVSTPNQFTHNCWPLTSNRHVLLTTDERENSFLAAYDTQDPSGIRELDRIQTTPGSSSIVHNTHIINDFAVTSWYTDGVTIVDATRPINLVQVGRFDTYDGTGPGFDGCWGAFPFFPSGTIVTSNIGSNDPNDPTRMYVLTPTYKRACYLEGVITDGCTGDPLQGATIKIQSADPLTETQTNVVGVFRTGQPTPGNFTVTVEKQGYITYTQMVNLATAQITNLNITLEKGTTFNSELTATLAPTVGGTLVLSNRVIRMIDPTGASSTVQTDAQGKVNLTCVVAGTYKFGMWGAKNIVSKTINTNGPVAIAFTEGYYDDFEMDLGWITEATSASGLWTLADPVETTLQGQVVNPGVDATPDANALCYTTGNGGGQAGTDDVDDGSVMLRSPLMNLTNYTNPILTYSYWFFNGGGQGTPNDNFTVRLHNGNTSADLKVVTTPLSEWVSSGVINLKGVLPITADMQVEFIATDDLPGHVVEAAVDIFEIKEGPTNTFEPSLDAQISATPNPFNQATQISYDLKNNTQGAVIEIVDAIGKIVVSQSLDQTVGSKWVGAELAAGVYAVRIRQEAKVSAPVRIVKL
jgi:choice-of-anchor B domain-containing protein